MVPPMLSYSMIYPFSPSPGLASKSEGMMNGMVFATASCTSERCSVNREKDSFGAPVQR
jgi:hypothetical protein